LFIILNKQMSEQMSQQVVFSCGDLVNKIAGSAFDNGKALVTALKLAAGNEALPEILEHWVNV
jgi:hypothetical protein